MTTQSVRSWCGQQWKPLRCPTRGSQRSGTRNNHEFREGWNVNNKILTIVGARPQFIKAATVSRVIARTGGLSEVLVHTGQHFDANMSDVFFTELGIPLPAHHLGISGGRHGAMTGRMLEHIEQVMVSEEPDCVIVYGDTNSTLAGALSAVKLGIGVVHVEAGLRSYNRSMPEEINRVLTDHAASLLLTPTNKASQNLRDEGIPADRIRQVGDVMFDAALLYASRAEKESRILQNHRLPKGQYVLATIHRQENTDDPNRLRKIFEALRVLSEEITVAVPLHPRTRARLIEFGLEALLTGLRILPPAGYLDMVMLERGAAVIATDSGGVQKEAYFHNVPCVTLRDETEWEELVDLGWNRLAPVLSSDIVDVILTARGSTGKTAAPYGNGKAAEAIVAAMLESGV